MNTTNKRQFLFAALALTGIFAIPCAQGAVILYTSPVWADNPTSYHACNVTNIGTTPLTVKTEILDSAGVVLQTDTFKILAGGSREITDSSSGFARCRFTTTANRIRANITVFHYNTDHYETLALDPAR
jgi:hypothetical protein